ncbi:hypothetical protein POL68_25465 [Stigmatella sp. ncwal1]|uniref:Uncharacterized protein n=1 Tax=Stigmatella ashevillensis TaxID=2995309 RepID=A0ABT5DE31_9BACT|nr:hypothetical protein [Stigmatella ashevillena]MDC0711050.1 hypothetical protein [Stigmatella ashevillena]MDC0711844.1 hypothetical protein [Stigmatella ashevillena]
MSIGGVSSQLTGGILKNTKQQNDWIAQAPPEMRPQMQAQLEMQKMQELVQMITQMMKAMHEMSMSVIRNIGG